MNEYLKSNPIAKQLSVETYKLFENEDVDNLLKKTNELLLSAFKKVVFDIASEKNRNPDSFRKKFEDVSNSSSVKGLIAKLKDYASDVELIDSGYAEIKKLYIDSIGMLGDAIKRAVELDPSLEAKIIDYFKSAGDKIQKTMDIIAKEIQKSINEGLTIGFHGRADRLKKILINLITDSKGKDSKSGYGRDWHRLFTTMQQKLQSIDIDKNLIKDSDRKTLSELEKKIDNLAQEYNQYKIKATELIMKKIVKDDELAKKFADLNDILTDALDQMAKAYTQEGIVEVKIREDLEEKESKMNDRVFPLKLGDKDTDPRLKGSGLIESIQKALMNAYIPIKNLLSPRGGADGKFDDGTSVSIKTLQGTLGNKNVDGKLDKPLLDSILKLDQLSKEDKDAIKDSLSKLRKSYSGLSESAMSSIEFMKIYEMTYIDPEEIEEELKKYAEELGASAPEGSKHANTSDHALAEKLAKLLRTKKYNKNAEAEDFLREDDTLKGSYPHNFISSWIAAVGDEKNNSYFFIEDDDGKGGLYTTKRTESNVNKPCNWSKYSEISGDDDDDVNNFGKWYTSYYKNFSGVDKESRNNMVSDVINFNKKMAKNAKSDVELPYSNVSDSIDPIVDEIADGFIRRSALNEIYQSIKGIAGSKINSDNLTPAELRFIYNMFIFLTPLITFDSVDKKWVCALEYIMDKFNGKPDDIIKSITKNKTFSDSSKLNKERIAFFESKRENDNLGIEFCKYVEFAGKVKEESLKSVSDSIKKLKLIKNAKDKHLLRIAISTIEDIKQSIGKNIAVLRKYEG